MQERPNATRSPRSMSSYNAVPPVYGGPTAEESAAASSSADADGPPLSAAQARLAVLKARLSDARKKNHKEVVEEDRRDKMGPEALKKEQSAKAWEKRKAAGDGEKSATEKMMSMTAADAGAKHQKSEKKQKRRAECAWDMFNNEAEYRNHKKVVRRAGDAGRLAVEGAEGSSSAAVDDGDFDPLDYGTAPPVPQERVQALVDDMHEAALRRANRSRRRTFDEASDVTYINKRNEVFNKKIERVFAPYTADIKANLERGTAL